MLPRPVPDSDKHLSPQEEITIVDSAGSATSSAPSGNADLATGRSIAKPFVRGGHSPAPVHFVGKLGSPPGRGAWSLLDKLMIACYAMWPEALRSATHWPQSHVFRGLSQKGMEYDINFDGFVGEPTQGDLNEMLDRLGTWRGDTDVDGDVDSADYTNLALSWGVTSGATWMNGDFNGDGDVDSGDYTEFALSWQNGVPPGPIPEPATLSLLALGGLALLRGRWK